MNVLNATGWTHPCPFCVTSGDEVSSRGGIVRFAATDRRLGSSGRQPLEPSLRVDVCGATGTGPASNRGAAFFPWVHPAAKALPLRLVLIAASYPEGGISSGHVIVLWNWHEHGYFISLHFAAYSIAARIAAALTIARARKPTSF